MHNFGWDDPNDPEMIVSINHNGDFSGDAIVTKSRPNGEVVETFTVPAGALVAFGKFAIGGQLIELLEENGFA